MAIKLEEMMNEFRYPTQITTDKNIVTSGSITASNISTLTTGSAAGFTVNGPLTVTGTAAVTATATFNGGLIATGASGYNYLGNGGPGIFVVSITGAGAVPDITAVTGSIAFNIAGTGPASRAYISKGVTAWTSFTTAA